MNDKRKTTNWILIFLRLKVQEIWGAIWDNGNNISVFIMIFVGAFLMGVGVAGEWAFNHGVMWLWYSTVVPFVLLVSFIAGFFVFAMIMAFVDWIASNYKMAKRIAGERKAEYEKRD